MRCSCHVAGSKKTLSYKEPYRLKTLVHCEGKERHLSGSKKLSGVFPLEALLPAVAQVATLSDMLCDLMAATQHVLIKLEGLGLSSEAVLAAYAAHAQDEYPYRVH
jgi:hypothetical protein